MSKEWVSLHNYSHYSLLKGLSKGSQLINRAHSLGQKAIALTDEGVLSGVPSFIKASKNEKKGINVKPINGIKIFSPTGNSLCLLAKNLNGWKKLIKLNSLSNNKENLVEEKPTLKLDEETLKDIGNDVIAFSGHLGSELYDVMFADSRLAFLAKSYDDAKSLVLSDWKDSLNKVLDKYKSIFGDNFYIEIAANDEDKIPAMKILNKTLRFLAKKNGFKTFASAPSYYANKNDSSDQRILLSTDLNVPIKNIETALVNSSNPYSLKFFKSNSYHIPSIDEISSLYSDEELKMTLEITEKCEEYNIFSKPRIPKFNCGDKSQEDYLREQCRRGWVERIDKLVPKSEHPKYVERIKQELQVINEAGLAGYFLIVQDYCRYAKSRGWMMAPGRGSGGGCLVSYLTAITELDPIYWGLSFERFYNVGRNSPGNISLPDIDCDFPLNHRDEMIEYVRQKYGEPNVSQMATYSRMQGKGGLKDVLRAHDACSFGVMNKVTENIPDEAEISDQLQIMREENDGEASIIQWALENPTKELGQYCKLDEEGNLIGEYSRYFSQAIRLEGTKKSRGKHAAGVIISTDRLDEIVPMVYDKGTGRSYAGFEMSDLEKCGLVKFDFLSIAPPDKLMTINELLAENCGC